MHDLAHITLNLIQELGGVCLGVLNKLPPYLYRDALDLEGNVFKYVQVSRRQEFSPVALL